MSQLLRPFRALRPNPANPEKVAEISAVPYDVVNREEAAALAAGNPLSFLHVSRAEIDLPSTENPYSPAVYEKAKAQLMAMIRSVPMATEATPSLYIYRLAVGEHVQTGVVGTFSIDAYDHGRIKKHERTRSEKEDDRTRHVLTLGAQTGPVFLAFRATHEIKTRIFTTARTQPLYDFTASDGVRHTIWRVGDAEGLARFFEVVPTLYIADGHHRAASASRARAEKRAANARHTGTEDYNFMLAVAFPADELRILPYHRVLKDLNGHTPERFLEALRGTFEIAPGASPNPEKGCYAMYLGKTWYGLKPKKTLADPAQSLIASLDVSVLQDQVLAPLLGIRDPRTDQRIDFVGGIRGTPELERLVNSGKAALAFALHPTSLDELMQVSDAGEIMPPKSTWFEPKLRDGLLSHWI